MIHLQDLGADPLCSVVAFAAGAEIVALLKTTRRVRTTLAGPVARKHFQALSIARWGESCRCRYAVVSNVKGDAHGGGDSVENEDDASSQVHCSSSSSSSGGSISGSVSSSSSRNTIIQTTSSVTEVGSTTGTTSGSSSTIATNTTTSNSSGSGRISTSAATTTGSGDSSGGGASGSKTQTSPAVHDGDGDVEADWLTFYLRRIGHRAAWPSPLDLLQEHYAEDAYRLLACCILCSRTSGGDTVKNAVAAFFKACPTPTSVLSADQEELRKTLLPLGLNREVIVKRFAEGFLGSAWYDPSELHGCGRFASDSWQIFCLGIYRPGDQVVAAAAVTAVVPANGQAVEAGDKGGSAKKSKSRAGGSRRGTLDRNLAAYCRSAQRHQAPDWGTAEETKRDGGDVGALSGATRPRESAADASAATTASARKKRKTTTKACSVQAKDDLKSMTYEKRGQRAQTNRSSSARGGAGSERAGGQKQPRRGLSKAGDGGRRGILAVGSTSNRDERASRRREVIARGIC